MSLQKTSSSSAPPGPGSTWGSRSQAQHVMDKAISGHCRPHRPSLGRRRWTSTSVADPPAAPGEVPQGNTHCRGSSTGGSCGRRTAPPRRGRRCGSRHRTCCLLPSSAWRLCVPGQAGGEKGRVLLTAGPPTAPARGQPGLRAPSDWVCQGCLSAHQPALSSAVWKRGLPPREKRSRSAQLPSPSDPDQTSRLRRALCGCL